MAMPSLSAKERAFKIEQRKRWNARRKGEKQ